MIQYLVNHPNLIGVCPHIVIPGIFSDNFSLPNTQEAKNLQLYETINIMKDLILLKDNS